MSPEDNKNLLLGIDQFNRREFFECHETLEALWMHCRSAERELIQGIIQIAVGYYHYRRANRVGALKLLTRGLERIKKFEPSRLRLDVSKLSSDISADIEVMSQPESDEQIELRMPSIEVLTD